MALTFIFYLYLVRSEGLLQIPLPLLLILEGAYLSPYFRLENGVQKLWETEQRLYEKIK